MTLLGSFANAVLLKLDPDLRPHLYVQEQSDIVDGQTFNTLRFPKLGAFTWDLEMTRMKLTIHDEEFEDESLAMTGLEADKFHFELLPGGTVKLGLRVRVGAVEDEDVVLKLLRASHQALLISLEQAAEEDQGDLYDQTEQVTRAPQSEASKELAALFSNPVGAQSPEELVGLEPESAPE